MSGRTGGHQEVETKFDVDSTFVLPPLTRLDGIASAAGPTEERLDAVYYDTDDLLLARNLITLRRREGGHDAGWHLKLPSDQPGRVEITRPLAAVERDEAPGGGGNVVPGQFADIVTATTRGRPLREVARIRTVRQAVILRDADGRELAELADDEVHAQTLGAATTLSRWREIEVEALGDDHDVLAATSAALVAAGARPAHGPSKLARALGERATRPELPDAGALLAAGATAGQVVQGYLSTNAAALLAADARVRLGEPESVHDLRVAARRLRSVLRTFDAFFEPPAAAGLQERLRTLNLLLNPVRDGEVQLARFSAAIRSLDPRDVLGPVAARIQGRLGSQELRGREQALEWLRGAEYAGLLEDLMAFVREPPFSALGREADRRTLLRPVCKADRKLRRRVERAMAAAVGPDQDAALHSARKAAKQLRYASEAVTPACGPEAAKHARRAKKIQNILGEHQDCVVAQTTLRDFGIAANLAGESSFSYGLLLGEEREKARLTRETFAARWPRLSRRRHRRWLR